VFPGISTLVDGPSMAKGVAAHSATSANVLKGGAPEAAAFGSAIAVCRRVGLEAGSTSPSHIAGPRRPKARNIGAKAAF
jgi:hypothetical protein